MAFGLQLPVFEDNLLFALISTLALGCNPQFQCTKKHGAATSVTMNMLALHTGRCRAGEVIPGQTLRVPGL